MQGRGLPFASAGGLPATVVIACWASIFRTRSLSESAIYRFAVGGEDERPRVVELGARRWAVVAGESP